MTISTSNRNLARELTGLATEVDSLTKSFVRVQKELGSELTRRQHFEREAADLAAAVAQGDAARQPPSASSLAWQQRSRRRCRPHTYASTSSKPG